MIRLRIKEVAESKGYNQSSLARAANLGFSTVQRLFRDPYHGVSTHTLDRIAKALDVDPRDLIELVPDEPPEKP